MRPEVGDETSAWVRRAKAEGRDVLDVRSYDYLCIEQALRELEQSSVARCLRAHNQKANPSAA